MRLTNEQLFYGNPKLLRQQTGVGLTKCKEALAECNGNLEEAVVYLRKLGLASASKKNIEKQEKA